MRSPILIGVGLSLLLAATPAVATTYDTTPSWNGASGVGPFGKPNNATFGQTFVAPSDPILQSFKFYLSGAGVAQVQAEVFAWAGALRAGSPPQGATGPALYTSASFSVGPTAPGVFLPYTITTGGLSLTAGSNYVALFTVSGPDPSDYSNSASSPFLFGYLPFSHASNDGGGGAAFDDNGSNYGALTSVPWSDSSDLGDLAFVAVFGSPTDRVRSLSTSVPEPGTVSVVAAALLLLGAVRRRSSLRHTSRPPQAGP